MEIKRETCRSLAWSTKGKIKKKKKTEKEIHSGLPWQRSLISVVAATKLLVVQERE